MMRRAVLAACWLWAAAACSASPQTAGQPSYTVSTEQLQRAIGERKVEAGQRSVSADLTREVLGRFKQSQARAGDTSAAQAAARLAEVIATQRELDGHRKGDPD